MLVFIYAYTFISLGYISSCGMAKSHDRFMFKL